MQATKNHRVSKDTKDLEHTVATKTPCLVSEMLPMGHEDFILDFRQRRVDRLRRIYLYGNLSSQEVFGRKANESEGLEPTHIDGLRARSYMMHMERKVSSICSKKEKKEMEETFIPLHPVYSPMPSSIDIDMDVLSPSPSWDVYRDDPKGAVLLKSSVISFNFTEKKIEDISTRYVEQKQEKKEGWNRYDWVESHIALSDYDGKEKPRQILLARHELMDYADLLSHEEEINYITAKLYESQFKDEAWFKKHMKRDNQKIELDLKPKDFYNIWNVFTKSFDFILCYDEEYLFGLRQKFLQYSKFLYDILSEIYQRKASNANADKNSNVSDSTSTPYHFMVIRNWISSSIKRMTSDLSMHLIKIHEGYLKSRKESCVGA